MNWHDHKGGACPVNEKATVRVRWANGRPSTSEYAAGKLRWSNTGHDYDIAGYKVTSVELVDA